MIAIHSIRQTNIRVLATWSLVNLPISVQSHQVTIVVDEYPPYIDSKKTDKGLLSNIVRQAFNQSGINVKFDYQPWKRIEIFELDNNERLSIGYIPTEERLEKWSYSDPIISSGTVIIALKSTQFSWKTIHDLKKYHIGLSRGYSYGEEFDKVRDDMIYEFASTDEVNIAKVLKGQVDIFPVDPYVGAEILRTRFTQKERNQLDVIREPSLSTDTMHVVCSKQFKECPHWLALFNEGLEKLKKSGVFFKLIDEALNPSS